MKKKRYFNQDNTDLKVIIQTKRKMFQDSLPIEREEIVIGFQFELEAKEVRIEKERVFIKITDKTHTQILKKETFNIWLFQEFQLLPFNERIFKKFTLVRHPVSTPTYFNWFTEVIHKRCMELDLYNLTPADYEETI